MFSYVHAWVCGFEGVQIPPNSPAFDTTLSERGFVFLAHGPLRRIARSAHQAAALLGIGRTILYELIRDGAVRPIRIGRCVRFLVCDLEA